MRARGGLLFLLGVDGSAANCSHAVNEFRKLFDIEAYTPVDNVSELTARTHRSPNAPHDRGAQVLPPSANLPNIARLTRVQSRCVVPGSSSHFRRTPDAPSHGTPSSR